MVSNSVQGMDVVAVAALASELNAAGEEIRGMGTSLTAQLEGTFWEGDDATTFRSNWDGELLPLLQQVSIAVSELGTEAERQAAGQSVISGR